ncbi:MAG: ABC transporter ATP-binding protein [Planctomycetes bacterium]|nr:ABC transporter ATP-binding protein [Planctomycetota bacterium]MBI3832727.1 ABC transporter ATP-binding protein [Planctomycetota bacterium]
MNVIHVEKLTKRYGARLAVNDISFNVPKGSLFGFLGPNGSGKTTTMRIMLGLLKSTTGTARVFDRDPWRAGRSIKADMGYLPGDLRLYPWLNGEIAVSLFGKMRGRDLREEGGRLLKSFDLDPRVRVRNMSRGMKQKLGIILALAHQPSLLILDEPTSSLDPLMQACLYDELRKRVANGCTVFLSSHSLNEVEALCDQVVILREGRVVADATIESLRRRARRRIKLIWKDGSQAPPVPATIMEITERRSGEWSGILIGPADEFIRWAASQPIADLSIHDPDLATLFQEFYR